MPKSTIETNSGERDFLESMNPVKTNYKCDLCKDKGYTLNDEDRSILCKCTKTKLWHERFEEAGIAKIFFDKTLFSAWNLHQDAYGTELSPNDKKSKQIIYDFMNHYNKCLLQLCRGEQLTLTRKNGVNKKVNSLVIIGGVRSGKSLLASISAQDAIKKYGLTAKMYDWTYLCEKLSHYEFSKEQAEIAKEFGERDIIVVDGVQDYKINHPCFIFELDRVVNARLRSGKPIIITADVNVDFEKMNTGQHWKSLIASCYTIKLPTKIKN